MSMLKPEPSGLDEAIADVLAEMKGFTADQPEFAKMVKQLERLYKIKSSHGRPSRMSLSDALPVIGNLAGILAILSFERTHVITSKALSFVTKSRI